MKRTTLIFCITVCLMITGVVQAQAPDNTRFGIKPLGSNSNITLEFLDGFIASQMEAKHISGLAASVVVGNEIVWTKEAGLANRETGMEVTDSTLFLTYSVSKMFTGLALMQLYDKGLFGLDDNINDYLPFEVVHPQFPNVAITFRMLMTHTSGITEPWSVISSVMVEGYDWPGNLHDFLEDFFVPGGQHYSTSHFSNYAPGNGWFYSNVGATLAGYLTEVISGIPFNQYCKDSLLVPMDMNHSSFHMADLDTSLLARPYEFNGASFIPLGHISNATLPAGFLRTSNQQMANFLKTMVNHGNFEGKQIIAEATLDTMTRGHIFPNQNIGLFMAYDFNYDFWGHTGGLSGLKTFVFFHKTENWGVSLLTNGDGDYYDIAYMLSQYAREFSAINLLSFAIEDENGNELLEPGEEVDLVCKFRNAYQRQMQNARVILRCTDEKVTVVDSVFQISSINPDEVVANTGNPFRIVVAENVGYSEAILEFIYFEGNENIGKEQFPVYTGSPEILLIDDEEHPQRNKSQSMTYYIDALNNLDEKYYFRNLTLSPLNEGFLNQFQKVIWFTGISNANSNILPPEEQDFIMQYLDDGGNILLSSQNAGDYCGNTELFTDYLKVNHIENTYPGQLKIEGIDNDTIGDGMQFYLYGGEGNNSTYSASVIETAREGTPVFYYANTNYICGVRFSGNYKSVFLPWGIESMSSNSERETLFGRVLEYFDDPYVGVDEIQNSENNLDIFPNPCREQLNIRLPKEVAADAKLQIFDKSGRKILVKEFNSTSKKTISLNTQVLIPGIYLLQLSSGGRQYNGRFVCE